MSEITGKLLVKKETKEFGSNGFTKREFVIETDSQYPQKILIELIKDKCSLIDKFNIGDVLSVSYNINGREWINPQGEAVYFNAIQGWRIEQINTEDNGVPSVPQPNNVEEDDLPF